MFSQNTPNAYDLAWIMTEMTPVQSSQPSAIAAQIAAYQRGATADERYGSIVRLGKTPDPTALAALIPIAQNPDTKLRLLALIAMGFAGKSNGPLAAGVLGKGLRDTDKINRGVAMNALRLLGPQDALYAVEDIIIFFKTKENVYQSSGVLRSFPVAYLKPLKLDFETILADPKLTAFQKESVVEILLKIENAQ